MTSPGGQGAAGSERDATPAAPGRHTLTPAELHARRVAWGKEWGQVGREIKQAHERERA